MKRAGSIEEKINAKRAEIAATERLLQRQRIELEDLEKMRHEPADRTAVRTKRQQDGNRLKPRP